MQITKSIILIIALEIMVLATIPAWAQSGSHDKIKEADRITYKRTDDSRLPYVFNYGTSFVILINRRIPDVNTLRENLAKILTEKQVIDKILFSWFGKTSLETLEIKIGSRVPLNIAQAVLKVFSRQSALPIIITIDAKDGGQRVLVGGLMKTGKNPMNQEKIDALLREKISQEEFMRIAKERTIEESITSIILSLWPFGPHGWICRHIAPSAYIELVRNFLSAVAGGCGW